MAKRVQVVLSQDVRKLGKLGDLVEVAPGYARNYLMPKGIGLEVTPGVLKQVERRKELERQRQEELKAEAAKQQAAIEKAGKLTIEKNVGEEDAIFGTVTNQEIADAIKSLASVEVDKRHVEVPSVSKIGDYTAEVELHPEVKISVEFSVVAAEAAE
ncbi:50S ribosomal protein L9 [filamentous cyanobacterium LEGE 11480]|uniref:Large ribosomal subunit protein bL9 n=1 Tax=Romeriopsis navalis LEGE 11480 TaxID=2777977 RepID=A0A928VPX0_9CYAN|nr:50S ribosomal protein L9 [Romeriopsis navalis]MBE9032511.1 50S ribosomal protein L9 [Romeriopsis navalis LEGE 11480]